MRKLSLVVIAAMLLVSGNVLANDAIKEDPAKKLSTQIGELLQNNNLDVGAVNLTAEVRFTLNSQGEIVVLSVKTKNEYLESFVKGRLNYRKVDAQGLDKGKLFTIPVRVTS